jgi:hypothetical protein
LKEKAVKVLVATNQTQGYWKGDYHWALDGELVTPLVVECCNPDQCGCARGFPGLASSKPTTTAMVADLPHVGVAELERALRDALTRDGWLSGLKPAKADDVVHVHLSAILEICAEHRPGTIVRRQGDLVFAPGPRAA